MATTPTPAQQAADDQAEKDRQAAARAAAVARTDAAAGNTAGVTHANAVHQADLQAADNVAAQQRQAAQTGAQATATQQAAATASTDTQNGANATASITTTLNQLGLSAMAPWATALAYSLTGQGIDPTTATNTVISQMNNPQNADGSINQDALNAFNTALPGFNQLIQNTGQNGSPGASPAEAIANYITYSAQIQQFASQAQLLPGTISATDIGNLWAGQVSTSEASQRITDAVVTTATAPQQVQDYLSQNFGMTPTALTSYFLNPDNTMKTITTNMNTGMVGGEASITGFDQDLSVANAQSLGAFLANGASGASSSALGQVNPVSAQQAASAFTTSLGAGQASASGMVAHGFETALPGQAASGPGVLSEDQLINAIEGNPTGQTATRAATESRTAASRGGGGYTTSNSGATGVGFGSQG